MTLPKFATTASVDKQTRRAKRKSTESVREHRAREKIIPQAPKSSLSPATAMATLSEAWNAAQVASISGTPVESPTAQLILAHIDRTDDRLLIPADRAAEILEAEGSQDALVAKHRVDIAEARRIVMALIDELDFAIRHEALFDLIAAAVSPADDSSVASKNHLRKAIDSLLSLPSRVDMSLKLGNTLRALVPLERQAAGLQDGYVDAATERAKRENAQVATVVATSFDAIRGRFDQIMLKMSKTQAS